MFTKTTKIECAAISGKAVTEYEYNVVLCCTDHTVSITGLQQGSVVYNWSYHKDGSKYLVACARHVDGGKSKYIVYGSKVFGNELRVRNSVYSYIVEADGRQYVFDNTDNRLLGRIIKDDEYVAMAARKELEFAN